MDKEYFDRQTKKAINYSMHLMHASINSRSDNLLAEQLLETLFLWKALVVVQMRNNSNQEIDRAVKKLAKLIKSRGYLYTRHLARNLFDGIHSQTAELDDNLQTKVKYLKKQGLTDPQTLGFVVMRLCLYIAEED